MMFENREDIKAGHDKITGRGRAEEVPAGAHLESATESILDCMLPLTCL